MKIIFFILTSILYRIGGEAKELEPFKGLPKKFFRTMVLPGLISLTFVFTHPWLALLNFGNLQALRMGYGIPDETDKGSFLGRIFKEGWLTRAIWGFIVALSGSTILFINHQPQEAFFYMILVPAISGTLVYLKANDKITDIGIGMGVSSLIWLIR